VGPDLVCRPKRSGPQRLAAEGALADLAPPWLFWSVVEIGDPAAVPHPAEAALVIQAVPRRMATFAAGRLAARRALEAGGCSCAAAPILRDGQAPRPPPGWRLSISHTDDLAVAVACRAEAAAGVGVDIERFDRMHSGLRRYVLGAADRFPEDAGPQELTLAFSLREAVFKALDPQMQAGLERIELGWNEGAISARLIPGPLDARLSYGARRLDSHVLSLCLRGSGDG